MSKLGNLPNEPPARPIPTQRHYTRRGAFYLMNKHSIELLDKNQTRLCEIADEIKAGSIEGAKYQKHCIGKVVELGKLFCEAKKLCPHGTFLTWCEDKTGYSPDSVQRFMRSSKGSNLNLLDFKDAAYKLLGTGTAHVSHNSGENEWYTPEPFIAAARATMGSIDCDPASHEIANEIVKAKKFFTKEQNGLEQKWHRTVWLNPPYAQPLVAQFSKAVADEFDSGEIKQACILVNNATETEWFGRMIGSASAVCFPQFRVRFLDQDGKPGGPLQGQAVIYMGNQPKRFADNFKAFGFVLCPMET